MADAFGGSRVQVKAPERGIFPLDHDGECKSSMKDYLLCLNENKRDHFPCKALSRAYSQCRMDRNLMAKEDLDNLGLGEKDAQYVRVAPPTGSKEKDGFLAGLGVRGSNKSIFFSKSNKKEDQSQSN